MREFGLERSPDGIWKIHAIGGGFYSGVVRGVCRLPPSDIDAHGFANVYCLTLKEIIFLNISSLTP